MSNYIKIKNIQIKDGDNWVNLKGILKNEAETNWLKIYCDNNIVVTVTTDHPFVTEQGKTMASDLIIGQTLYYNDTEVQITKIEPIRYTAPSYDVETESGMFTFSGIKSYNCRTVNGADINGLGHLKTGRGNICPVTIIMPTLAMQAGRDVEKFMKLLDKKIFEAKDMLTERFEYICSQSPKSAQFMYENSTMTGYVPEEGIRSALKHGTLVIGQIGLNETLMLLLGVNHTTPEGMELAKRIESLFKTRCAEFKQEYKLNFGVYYTPAEGLCYTAMKKFRAKYGVIEGVSDKEYFTNSIHVPVYQELTPFEKIDVEAELTGYSNAGCITYVELPSTAHHNVDALENIVNYAMSKDIPYMAINTPNDTCEDCGAQGEFNERCPACSSSRISRLRRVTGYITGNYTTAFNWGKQKETEARVQHSSCEVEIPE